MELMNHSHVHFIQAIKGGLVVKVLNVDSHGMPAFRFKQIKAINDSQDARNLGSCSTLKQREGGFTGLSFGRGRVKTEMPFPSMGGITIQSELKTYELNEDDGDIKGNSDWDDDSCTMKTLQELKERWKLKKRKLAKSDGLSRQEMEACSPLSSISIKRGDDTEQSKEDVCDLNEPLSSLILKLSKKSQAKSKRIRRSMPSNYEVSVGALTEQILTCPHNSLQNTRDIHEPVKIKIEILEPDSSDCQNIACVADGSTSDSHAEMTSRGECSDDTPKGINGGQLETGESTSFTEETPSCAVTEVSLGCLGLEEASLPVSTSEVFGEVTKVGFLEMTNHESLPRFVPECPKELNVTHPLPHYCPEDSVPFANDEGSESVSHQTFSFQQEQISCHMDSDTVTQMSDMAVSESLCYTEFNYGSGGCVFDKDGKCESKEGTPSDLRHNVMDGNTVAQMPNMVVSESLCYTELNYGSGGCVFDKDGEYDSKEDTPSDPRHNVMDGNTVAQMPDMVVSESFCYTELNYGSGGCVFNKDGECDSKEDIPSDLRHNVMDGNTVLQMPDMAVSESLCYTELNYGSGGCVFDKDGECDSKEDTPSDLRLNVMDGNTVAQLPDMAVGESPRSMELNYGGDGCISGIDGEGDSKEDSPPNLRPNAMSLNGVSDSNSLCSSSQTSHPCVNHHNDSDFMDDGSPTAWEKLSSITANGSVFAGVDEALKCSSGNHSSVGTDRLKAVEEPKNHHGLKLERHPKRLFSIRKAISPTSQEKLRQALDAEESHDNIESSKCRERLCFEKQTKNRDSPVRSDLEGPESSISPEQIIKKRKIANNGSPQLVPKGILKAPHVSRATQHAGTECTSIHTSAQKAIAFSQRQMQDIESLATKLMAELKSMKEIMEETLCSEVYPSTSSKYTSDEMRMTIENVEGTEETTRKWLSMMAKDCNRFCKIMRSTERKAVVASGNGVPKENKRIIFADEAGGKLCHVKVFEKPHVALLETESQKAVNK